MVVNGVLAMSELALMSSRRGRLEQLAQAGDRGARAALRLLDDPTAFLSTVQVGITLVGILAGALSGATLGRHLADMLAELGVARTTADTLGIGGVVVALTYLSLIVGELVPKRLALANPSEPQAGSLGRSPCWRGSACPSSGCCAPRPMPSSGCSASPTSRPRASPRRRSAPSWPRARRPAWCSRSSMS